MYTRPFPRPAIGAPGFLTAAVLGLFLLLPTAAPAQARPPAPAPLYVHLIDQLAPQGAGPAVNGLDERRRGPLFVAALRQVVREGELPAPLIVINQDLSLPDTLAGEPGVPPGAVLVRIYLTQWSQTAQGGVADTEVLCRFFVETLRGGRVTGKSGPFFARQRLDVAGASQASERWDQYQAVAHQALVRMAAAWRGGGR